jgi:hypothetical protein
MTQIKNKVYPEDLEKWFTSNRETVYLRSLEAAKELVEDQEKEEEILFEFYWDEKIYSKIFMSRKDVKTAMEKALNFFVAEEMFEKAQEIKNLTDSLESVEKSN